jgi:hypothetical protein
MSKKITKNTTLKELMAIVSEHLSNNNIPAILTGGSVVSFYTDNKYESMDLDFLSTSDQKDILKVMEKIGFVPTSPGNKNLGHKECPITVEFPGRVLIIGDRPEKVEHEETIDGVKVVMLSPTQSVMDRLAAYIFWDDRQGLDQAEWICEKQPVNIEKIKKWVKSEGASKEKLEKIIENCLRGIRKFNEGASKV